MKLTHEGLSLWYGTPDAPAPRDDEFVPRNGASLVVGVHPPSPINSILVYYRVDGGIVHTVPGLEIRVDHDRDAQYFGVGFPDLYEGEVVEYSPVLGCGGRQVPPVHTANRFRSKFRLTGTQGGESPNERSRRLVGGSSAGPVAVSARSATQQRFSPSLEFVGRVIVQFDPFQYAGETVAGMRINFVVREGRIEGERLRATLSAGSVDHMLVRRDGIGVVRFRGGFVTDDGDTLDVEAGGYVDFGTDGFRRAISRDLPDIAPLIVSPLISTQHAKYEWLSRIQCVGVGQTHLDAQQASYNVYSPSPRVVTSGR